MNKIEIDVLNQAVALLRSLTEKPTAATSTPGCPVKRFVEGYLTRHANMFVTCADLYQFYEGLAAAGKAEPLLSAEFFRRLSPAMEAVFGVKKCHNLLGPQGRVRGFHGVAFRIDGRPITREELEPPIEAEPELPEPDLDPRPDDFDPSAPTVIDARPVKI